jgi:hypothetical protein
MEVTQRARVSVTALDDVERFIGSAQQLKALTVQRYELLHRDSRRLAALGRLIKTFTQQCAELAREHPRLAELWKLTQTELNAIAEAEPPCDQPNATRSAPCSPGARGAGATTNGGD